MKTGRLLPREQLAEVMRRIYRFGMTTASGGNLSLQDSNGNVWITPARVDKGELQPDDIVCVHPDGTHTGRHEPSSELPFHREIYRSRPDFKAIVHAHPGALVAFSLCRKLPETRVLASVHAVCGKVAKASYACPGSEELGRNIAAAFATGANCVILENHGVVVGGRDIEAAFERFETLEFAAQMQMNTSGMGEMQTLADDTLARRMAPSFGELPPATLSEREQGLRHQICQFVFRAYRRRLMISTLGSCSARVDTEQFLVTPHRHDRLALQPSDLVRATPAACEAGKQPSRTARLHALIYQQHSGVGAIISAQPVHAGAFCLTKASLNTHTIPESYHVLREVPKLSPLDVVSDAGQIAAAVSLAKQPALLIDNEGALVVGETLLEAFDRLEVLEATAAALIHSRSIGAPVLMAPDAIEELRRIYCLDR
ncbi:MAG: class II aldolase/adducin family protein [Opitutaceae bacterium]|nr:class II aldolase/adducin family protein [Opitutaceae bacterium]